ncbi:MAG: hypothetical protein NTY66_01985 [Candidatus Vogelbacteria bacterium]|nr:hypothetical protein [Candidatus Vogelbacteria bacterium]
MKKNLSKVAGIALSIAPLGALAAINIISQVKVLLNSVVPILMTIALLYFIWGLIQYIRAAAGGNAAEEKQGKAIMIWGVVALFVMASVWGLVAAVGQTLGTGTGQNANTVITPGALIPQ